MATRGASFSNKENEVLNALNGVEGNTQGTQRYYVCDKSEFRITVIIGMLEYLAKNSEVCLVTIV